MPAGQVQSKARTRAFLSYSRKNAQFAVWLRQELEAADVEVFRDVDDEDKPSSKLLTLHVDPRTQHCDPYALRWRSRESLSGTMRPGSVENTAKGEAHVGCCNFESSGALGGTSSRLGFPVGSVQRAKADEVWPGIDRTYELAKKYKIKTAWGTDVLFSAALARQQGAFLASLTRWYTPAEALIMATSTDAELLELSGKRNPYPGKLGVVQKGALADLILVDGNPLENINLVADPGKSFLVIMKDGKIYKNTLDPSMALTGK